MAKSNGFGIVKSLKIGQSNATKLPEKEERSTTIMTTSTRRWYSLIPNKYLEIGGI